MPSLRLELSKIREEERKAYLESRVLQSNALDSKRAPNVFKKETEKKSRIKIFGSVKKSNSRGINGNSTSNDMNSNNHSPSESDSSSSCSMFQSSVSSADRGERSSDKSSPSVLASSLGSQLGDNIECKPYKDVHNNLTEVKPSKKASLQFHFQRMDTENVSNRAENNIRSEGSVRSVSVDVDTSPISDQVHYDSPKNIQDDNETCNTPPHIASIRQLISECEAPNPDCQQKRVSFDGRPSNEIHQPANDEIHPPIARISTESSYCRSARFEVDLGLDKELRKNDSQSKSCKTKLSFPKSFSKHLTTTKNHGNSLQPIVWEKMHKEAITSYQESSLNEDHFVKQIKSVSPKTFSEKYPLSIPMFNRSTSRIHSHNDCHKTAKSSQVWFGSVSHSQDSMKRYREAKSSSLSPLSIGGHMEKVDETTPLSPLALQDTAFHDSYNKYTGHEYVDMAWLATSGTMPPLLSPSKSTWDWRSKSQGAKSGLKSAVRNLEAAFVGSRSVSVPKTRSQMNQTDSWSEYSAVADTYLVSPAKIRHKRDEILKPIERPKYPGLRFGQDSSRRTQLRQNADKEATHYNIDQQVKPIITSKCSQKQKGLDSEFAKANCLTPSRRIAADGTFPYTPTLSEFRINVFNGKTPPIVQCCLQIIVRDDAPCYILSVNDSEEILLAQASELDDHIGKDGHKAMYTFHSGTSKLKGSSGWRSWIKKDHKNIADLVGKMQVSCVLSSDGSVIGRTDQSLVSECVLYGERVEDTGRSQSLRFSSPETMCKNNSIRSPMSARYPSDVIRSPVSASVSSKTVKTISPGQANSPLSAKRGSNASLEAWSDTDVADVEVSDCITSTPMHMELAAIVVQLPMDHCTVCKNFSRESQDCYVQQGGSAPRLHCNNMETHSNPLSLRGDSCSQMLTKQQCTLRDYDCHVSDEACRIIPQSVTVMLPVEHHGLPNGRVCRPTSLIQRWKCGGKCDCGGWDLGCGMKIFSTERSKKYVMSHSDHSLSHSTINIYSQGKTQDLVLSMSVVQEDTFMLNFRRELSSLEAFATSVAILHNQKLLSFINKLTTENQYK